MRASSSSLLGLRALVAGRASRPRRPALAAVAVMGLVVEDDDVLLACRSSRQTRRTIWSGVSVNGLGVAVGRPGSHFVELAGLDLLAQLEGVEVGDEDLGLACRPVELLGRDDVALAVVVLRVVGQQDAQPVADGDARA